MMTRFDFRKAGRLLLVVNFVLVAGVVGAGTDLFAPASAPARNEKVFRQVVPARADTAPETDAFEDVGNVSADRFQTLTRQGSPRLPAASPGAGSALENSYRVTGTMISNNEAFNMAVIEEIRSRRQFTAGVGDTVGTMTITAVRPEEVEVSFHGNRAVLKLDLTATRKKLATSRARPDRHRRAGRDGPAGSSNRAPSPSSAATPGKPARPTAGGDIAGRLAGLSPALAEKWQSMSPAERQRWEKWWNSQSPEQKKKWEKRFVKMARDNSKK